MHVQMCMHVPECGGQRSALGIFVDHSQILRQGLSVNLELTDSASLANK